VARQNTIREQSGVRSGMKMAAGRRERDLDRGARCADGRHHRPASTRSPSTDATGGVAEGNLGPEAAYAGGHQSTSESPSPKCLQTGGQLATTGENCRVLEARGKQRNRGRLDLKCETLQCVTSHSLLGSSPVGVTQCPATVVPAAGFFICDGRVDEP
jgi:hypothetical protein